MKLIVDNIYEIEKAKQLFDLKGKEKPWTKLD